MRLPNKVAPGDSIKASEWNAAIDCLRSLIPQPSKGIRQIRTSGGVTSEVLFPTPQTTNVRRRFPFELVITRKSESDLDLRVCYGTVNGTAPDGMTLGDSPAYVFESLSLSGGKVWLAHEVSLDILAGGRQTVAPTTTGLTLATGTDWPDDDFLEPSGAGTYTGTFYYRLGQWTAGATFNNNAGNLFNLFDCSADDDPSYVTAMWNAV